MGEQAGGDRQEQVKVVCSLSKHLQNFCIRCWAKAARQTKQIGQYTYGHIRYIHICSQGESCEEVRSI